MVEAIGALNRFSAVWAQAMGAVLWQSVLLAAIAGAILWSWRRLPPAGRCWVWRIVALKMLLMPFWSASVPLPDWLAVSGATQPDVDATIAGVDVPSPEVVAKPAGETAAKSVESTAVSPTPPSAVASVDVGPRLSWQAWLSGVWLAVIALQCVRLVAQRIRLARLLKSSRPATARLAAVVAENCTRLGITKPAETRTTDVAVSPFVCRLARPVIVMPAAMAESSEEPRLRQIVLHELAHVRRRDLAWCWLTHVMRMVFWFHPLAYWVSFREALERELACDALAMAHSGSTAADYAQTLVDAAARISQPVVLKATDQKTKTLAYASGL